MLAHYIGKKMSSMGSRVEMCLNILCNACNFQIFVNNLLRGKVVLPKKESSNFVSINGILDNRVDLDNNIKPAGRSRKYLASLCVMASKLAYENREFIRNTVENKWKMELLDSFSFEEDDTQALVFVDNNTNPKTMVVAFRGTEPFNVEDWSTDIDISRYELQGVKGRLHRGFAKALGLVHEHDTTPSSSTSTINNHAYASITRVVIEHLKKNNDTTTRLIVTGHSLGGALAVVFAAALVMHREIQLLQRLEAVYTFGQPRVGNAEFGEFMEEQFKLYGGGVEYCRFVYNNDFVPRIPPDNSLFMYKHFGKCIFINSIYEAEIVEEEPLKNYLACGSGDMKRSVDAMWEIVRSFFLPRMFGEDYKEGLVQLMFRMTGLVFPGLPDHGPRDYVNATRLATY